MSITESRMLGAQRSLCPQITREIRNGNHAGLSPQKRKYSEVSEWISLMTW